MPNDKRNVGRAGEMEPPEWLSDADKTIWQEVVEMDREGQRILRPLYSALLAAYVVAIGRCRAMYAAIREHGETYVDEDGTMHVRPEAEILRDASQAVLDAAAELCFTPMSAKQFAELGREEEWRGD
jgi:P27 family predicted phage terminase small subunit